MIDFAQAIREAVNVMIGEYAGHVSYVDFDDNSGVWDNYPSAPPAWTEERLIEYIEDIERLNGDNNLFADSAAWLYQQYKILNALKWYKKDMANIYNDYTSRRYKQINGADWSTVVSDYLSATWNNTSNSSLRSYSYFDGSSYTVQTYENKISFTTPETFAMSYDLYFYCEKTAVTNNTFFGFGDLDTENAYNLGASDGEQSFNFAIETDYILSLNGLNVPPQPGPPNTSYYSHYCNRSNMPVLIAKFDGPNGFKFRGDDW